MSDEETVWITAKIPIRMKEGLEQLAAERFTSLSAIVRQAVARELGMTQEQNTIKEAEIHYVTMPEEMSK